jgi:hypothetical protein
MRCESFVTLRDAGGVRRLSRVDRRALTLIAAAGLALAVPAWANAASDADALLAQSSTGTLTAQGIAAGEDTGTLSKDAKPSGKTSSSGSSSDATGTGASADALPFTGSDPRITLLLGLAALLGGVGLRLRTGDARDF